MQKKDQHTVALEKLVTGGFKQIGENPNKVKWIMKEGLWLYEDSVAAKPLCDVIAIYQDYSVLCAELKHSRQARRKAIEQLKSAERFVLECLEYDNIRMKIVYYDSKGFDYEVIK